MKKGMLTLLAAVVAGGTLLGFAESTNAAKAVKAVKADSKKKQVISSTSVEVLLHTRKMKFPDARPYKDENDRVLVPLRFVSEALGAKVNWDPKTDTATITKNELKVEMTVGKLSGLVNGQEKTFDTPMVKKQQRTYVPLRVVSEAFGEKVEWDNVSQWVWIGKKEFKTLEELGYKPQSIEPFKKYFKKEKFLLNRENDQGQVIGQFKKVMIIEPETLPFQFREHTVIMDMGLMGADKDKKSGQRISMRTNSRGDIGVNIFHLMDDGVPRFRNSISVEKHADKVTSTYRYKIRSSSDELLNIQNPHYWDLGDVKYIGFYDYSKEYMILMKNSWRES
ncbi:copper amine oxidase N-terminal domain-containing protein [Paenibacillus sp. 481]|uniref:copper amine oxidase N-terminal domain-containing protein n=1 Tax=Paenibacillus sp. 481 TaxID=2835869 RepID=UPI001E57AA77|nr:copper amine oxidase N-terminal domain-containing protein [Paenibacillus sp. 481]UHA72136.1 copper amine oxidase N-terminal domain-containing protein [Paenibacillus sp. 481]